MSQYFIRLSFEDQPEGPLRLSFLNDISTSLALDTEQVDRLIAAGEESAAQQPAFQRLLAEPAVAARSATPNATTPSRERAGLARLEPALDQQPRGQGEPMTTM